MAIKKPVKQQPMPDQTDTFISGAPDAHPAPEQGQEKAVGVFRGKKRIISLGIDPDLLELVDKRAAALHISRAAWFSQAITRAAEDQG